MTRKHNNHAALLCAAIVITLLIPGSAQALAQASDQTRTHLALRLLPEDARGDALVILRDSTGDRTAKNGTGFTCISDSSDPTRLSYNCHHPALNEQFALEREFRELRGAEFRERVCSEAEARGIRVPNGAIEITSSVTIDDEGDLDTSMTVYTLLWVPYQTEQMVAIADEDPGDAGPWLHRAGTCQAHVMWSKTVRPSEEGQKQQ